MSLLTFTLLILALGVLMLLLAVVVYFLVSAITTVPWVRTKPKMTRSMLQLARFSPGDRVLDLGCGDGSIVLEAVAMGGEGIGVERLVLLVWYARFRAWQKGFGSRAKFFQGDLFATPIPKAEIVVCYLFPEVNERLEPRLREALSPGTRVVSRDFEFPTLRWVESQSCKRSVIHVYEI